MEISPGNPLSQTGSARCTDLSYFSHRIWEIHAKYACFLRMQLLAKIGYIPQCKGKNPRGLNEILLPLARMPGNPIFSPGNTCISP